MFKKEKELGKCTLPDLTDSRCWESDFHHRFFFIFYFFDVKSKPEFIIPKLLTEKYFFQGFLFIFLFSHIENDVNRKM